MYKTKDSTLSVNAKFTCNRIGSFQKICTLFCDAYHKIDKNSAQMANPFTN